MMAEMMKNMGGGGDKMDPNMMAEMMKNMGGNGMTHQLKKLKN